MPPRKKKPPQPTFTETIQLTIELLEKLEERHNPRTLVELGWNLGWKEGIYYTDITEHPDYDGQALNFAIKVLEDILATHKE
jgi:hypothetical protein